MSGISLVVALLRVLCDEALAAPLTPVAVQDVPLSLEVSAALGSDLFYLRASGCKGDACTAVRRENMQGGEASLWFVPQFGVYGGAAHDVESTAAATYSGVGYRVHAGVKGGVKVRHGLGLNGWLTVTHAETTVALEPSVEAPTGPADEARRNQFEVGAAARFGEVDGGFDAWVGVEAMPYCVDLTRVVHGELKLGLKPFIPVAAVGGIRVLSEPLGGPWAKRGRLSAGVTGEVGYRVGVTGWLTASL
ncbi:MAG: hypothetical protein EXR69_11855 [Myxococcales bacterium]|nr:hypothetical protein [Myxococcales bacterium]